MICIDTNVLIWGVKRQATPNRRQMLERAHNFLRDCRDSRIQIMLPAQVVSEYLVGFDREAMRASLKILDKAFFLAPYSIDAAAIAAELRRDKTLIDSVRDEFEVQRQVIIADISIVATAIAYKATKLIAEDGHMRKLAQGRIIVQPLSKGLFDSES